MKKLYTVLAILFFLAMTSAAAFAERLVVAQNNAPTTTGKSIFVPKPVPIPPAMVKAAVSYTDAQDIRAEMEEMKKAQTLGDARSVIGKGMRAEKIRTYNFPQDRVTDHRINKSWRRLDDVMDGKIEKIILE